MIIYYCVTIIVNIISIIVFYENVNISGLSIIPVLLIALMIFQAFMFKNEKIENGFRIKSASNLTASEENGMLNSGSVFLFAMIPWMVPFVFFFSSLIKILSILVYVIGLIGGFAIYRLKNKEKISERMTSEEKERQEQEKKEQLGKWK